MSENIKIKNLLDLLKVTVDNESDLEKDLNSILDMFDQIKEVEVSESNDKLSKKEINIEDLRVDQPQAFPNFENKIKGKYFKVPSSSKKS